MRGSPPPVLDYLSPKTGDGLRSAFLRFPPFHRLVLITAALLLPCAAAYGWDDMKELYIVTFLAALLVAILLARGVMSLFARSSAPNPQTRRRWRLSACLVLAIWMLLIQGASCPHADYLVIGPWGFYWGAPCSNQQHFKPAVLWLLIDRHNYMALTWPMYGY